MNRDTRNAFRRLARTVAGVGLMVGTLATGGGTAAADEFGPGRSVTVTADNVQVEGAVGGLGTSTNVVTNSSMVTYYASLTTTDRTERRINSVAFHVPPELQYFTDSAAVTRFTQPYVEEHWKLTPVFDAAANTVTFADPGFYIPATEHGRLSVSVSFFIPPDSYEIGSSVDSGLTVDIDGLGKQTWNPIGLQFHIRSYEAEPCFLCVDYGGGDWDNGFWGFGSADLGRGDNETLNLVSMMLGS
ncbi:hypothetical protein [Rhodococcus sp. NPDC003348]